MITVNNILAAENKALHEKLSEINENTKINQNLIDNNNKIKNE